jgi:Lon protease-like protein
MKLPRDIRLFPLTGALLLPRGTLPLQVFEPRYLTMVEDALGSGRLIGVVQPADAHADPIPGDAVLSDVGCVGRIIGFEETDDGRFRIRLLGLSRFRIEDTTDHPGGFRVARVSYQGFADDLADEPGAIGDREGLEDVVRRYCDARGIDTDWRAIENASDEALVTSFSMMGPFAPQEKQALLECTGVEERARLLATLLELAAHGGADETGARH